MKYGVKHSCGHHRTVTLYGPGRERDVKLRSYRGMPCPACLTEITTDRAHDQIDHRELPELQGTPKQIEWATRCRYHALLLLDQVLSDAERKPETIPVPDDHRLPGESDPALGKLIERLYTEDRARFWIDHGQHARLAGTVKWMPGEGHTSYPYSRVEVAAELLLAAAGVAPNDVPKHVHRVIALLYPRADAVLKRSDPESRRMAAAVAGAMGATGLALAMRVDEATAIIRKALARATRPYVAFSGGKDSTVAAALVLAVRPDAVLHWTDDELEYPETVDLMRAYQDAYGEQFVVSLGRSEHAGWFTPWTDAPSWRDPLPGSQRKEIPADDWMAERGFDLTFLGTRAVESVRRADWFAASGPLYRVTGGTGLRCCPLWDWSTADVWAYLDSPDISVNAAYLRLTEVGVSRERQRIGPLPLTPRDILARGWPDLLERLEARYGPRWS